jgi:predicted transcriptional regulator
MSNVEILHIRASKHKLDHAILVLTTLNKEFIKPLVAYFFEHDAASLEELVQHTGWTAEKVKRHLIQLVKIKVIFLKDRYYLDKGRVQRIVDISKALQLVNS